MLGRSEGNGSPYDAIGDEAGEMGDDLPAIDLGMEMGTTFRVKDAFTGYLMSCAMSVHGGVKCWGDEQSGRLGYESAVSYGYNADEMGDNLPFVDFGDDFNVSYFAESVAYGSHTCVISYDNSAKCWGYGPNGELGYNDTKSRGGGTNTMGDYLPLVNFQWSSPNVSFPSTVCTGLIAPTTPTDSPTSIPTIEPYQDPSTDPTRVPSLGPTAITAAPTSPSAMAPTNSPTTIPTAEPSKSPNPTSSPISEPSVSPTTAHPTASEIMVNVSFAGDGSPSSSTPYLSDPFGRFEATITVIIDDEAAVLGDVINCESCFIWQYQTDGESDWTHFDHEENGDISMSIKKSGNEYTSKLVVQSIRRFNAGNCVDDVFKAPHPFGEDADYGLRLKFVSPSPSSYYVSETSNEINIATNVLPSGGTCYVENIDDILPLEPYNLLCSDWESDGDLEYNALINGVAVNIDGFVEDSQDLSGVAPSGNMTITVLVKEQNEYNAISCFEFVATFRAVDDLDAEAVDGILSSIDNITNGTSLAENPDVAVSIHSVVEDLYQSNLTAKSEAEKIVDDMVTNILKGSRVIVNDSSSAVNVSGNDIITELATVSSITSNEDIVDAESTTTQLVDEYLPNIFDAVDLFVDLSVDNTSSSTSTTEVQDALYSIGVQSQELISNLEDTLVDAISSDDSSNMTEQAIDSVNSLSESLVDYATLAASTALAQSNIEETFSFESIEYNADGKIVNSKVVNAVKFVADDRSHSAPKCGSTDQYLELPGSFMTDQEGTFDCAFMASTSNNFVPKGDQNEDRTTIADSTITVNIYGEGSRRRRRRLAQAVEYQSDECFPYLITFNVANLSFGDDFALDQSSEFPSCDFWNTDHSYWDTAGCFVYDITNDSVICGCTHLTTFSASKGEIWPKPRLVTHINWRKLTISNLWHYPTVVCVFPLFDLLHPAVAPLMRNVAPVARIASSFWNLIGNVGFVVYLSG